MGFSGSTATGQVVSLWKKYRVFELEDEAENEVRLKNDNFGTERGSEIVKMPNSKMNPTLPIATDTNTSVSRLTPCPAML